MTQAEKQAIIKEYATHEGDTGSPEVQVAVLTTRINELTEQDTVLLSKSLASVIHSTDNLSLRQAWLTVNACLVYFFVI